MNGGEDPVGTLREGDGMDSIFGQNEGSAARAALRRGRKRRRRKNLLIALLCISAGTLYWLWPLGATRDVEIAPATITVERRDLASSVLATGAVQPQIGAEVRVGARISSKVESLRVNSVSCLDDIRGVPITTLPEQNLRSTIFLGRFGGFALLLFSAATSMGNRPVLLRSRPASETSSASICPFLSLPLASSATYRYNVMSRSSSNSYK